MIDNNIGHWLIGFICCIEPILAAAIGIWAYKRFQRRGISGFIPKIRTEGLHR